VFGEVFYKQKLTEKVPTGSQISNKPGEDPIAVYRLINRPEASSYVKYSHLVLAQSY